MAVKAAFEKHSQLIAAVLTVVAPVLAVLLASSQQEADEATERIENLQPQLRTAEATTSDLTAALAEAEAENRDLRARVEDLEQQLGATPSAPTPTVGAVLYAGKTLKVPLQGCSGDDPYIQLLSGQVTLGTAGFSAASPSVWTYSCTSLGLAPRNDDVVLSLETGPIGTLASCEEAVGVAPVDNVALEADQHLCAVGDDVAAHLTVADITEDAVTYKVTAWERPS